MASITVQTPYNEYTGNGSATVYAYTFLLLAAADLVVKINGTTTTAYTLSGVGSSSGGNVTFTTAPASGATVLISREIPLSRSIEYQTNGDFRASTVNLDFNRLWQYLQLENARRGGALRVPYPEQVNDGPSNTARRDRMLAFNSTTGQPKASDLTETQIASAVAAAYSGAAGPLDALSFVQAGTGAVSRTAQDKAREWVSVKDFGATGDGSDEYAEIALAWNYCLANGKDLYFPAGTYSSGINNMPFKNPDFPATSLLDCGNITIYGDGPNTILKSDSVNGADVLNLYSVKNLHVRNMKITADLSGSSGAGSNGLSIVGGFDNLTFDRLWFENLPYVEKLGPNYLDGGKAFTIQTGTPAEECGTVHATHIYANGCVYGFGLEVDLVNFAQKKHAISINIVAENCYEGVVVSAGAASGALSSGITNGLKVNAQLVNCQQNVVLARAHGVKVDSQIITTKTIAARRLNPDGGAWASFDSVVVGLVSTYAKNSQISMVGDISNCDYIARIGGASAGSSGLGGQTDQSQFFIDVEGVAAVTDVELVNSGGDTINNSNLFVTTQTVSSLPTGFYTPALNNTITIGPTQRLIAPVISGALNFAYTDGISSYTSIDRDGFASYAKQTGSSSTAAEVFGVKDHTGGKLFFVRNDGFVATQGRATASSVSTVKQVMPIYDTANALVGYIPIYTTYA